MKKISYYIMLIAILVSQVMVAAPKKKSYKLELSEIFSKAN